MGHFLAVAEVAENVERHARDPRLLNRVDQWFRSARRRTRIPASPSKFGASAVVKQHQRQFRYDLARKSPELQSPKPWGRPSFPVAAASFKNGPLKERTVAEENFVRALARQNDGHELPRLLREKELPDRRKGDERQLREPQAMLEIVPQHLLGNLELVMLRSDETGRKPRKLPFVPAASLERNRERMER